jgi:hypothetical protein
MWPPIIVQATIPLQDLTHPGGYLGSMRLDDGGGFRQHRLLPFLESQPSQLRRLMIGEPRFVMSKAH